ncbi:uncharacterized protein LOC135215435 [Macrobrachium nipponense]|uniref:uncharacterized protein LOC135215435 n=1 Tax=Macrobrachium nipponense TaxID=159736 RepID=UPI0030C8B927
MRKYVETFILFVVGLGPTLIALLLMQQYGAIGVSCAIVLSSLYLVCIILALCCRICIPPPDPDSDEEEAQGEDPNDVPPSYDIVTSKPPPYYVLFASVLPNGEHADGDFIAGANSRRNTLSPTCEVPVHSFHQRGSTQGVHCYAWLEPCEDKELPSYEDALALSSSNTASKEETRESSHQVPTNLTDPAASACVSPTPTASPLPTTES